MTKDEITAKAQELTIKNVTDGKSKYYSWGVYKGCVIGLEYNKKQIADLEKENAELKEMYHESDEENNKLRENIPKLAEAKEIIEKLKALYFSPVVTKDDVKRQDKILEEAEQFLSVVEK